MIDFLIVLFGLAMIYIAGTSRIEAYVRALFLQGLLLFVLVLLDHGIMRVPNLVFLSFETLVIKAIVIPLFLIRIIHKNEIERELQPYVPNFYARLVASLIFGLGFYAAYWSIGKAPELRPLYFGTSVSTIVLGLLVIVTRRKIITHVIGFMLMENGIFLMALSIAKEMPFIVALGVLLDLFVAIYLFGMFIGKIHDFDPEIKVDTLTLLKDSDK
ncbi:MAG: hypothetical protein R2941_06730 [Desulfobacterales bacterium]